MKKIIASAVLAALISVSAVSAAFAETKPNSFIDIDRSYAKEAIQTLHEKGIVNGVDTKGHFDPKGTLTRAQFVTIMVKSLDLKAEATTSTFKDVNGWALPYVEAAYQAGIVNGVSKDKFDPNATVTREMSAKILVMSLQTKGSLDEQDAALTFKDADKISTWAKPYIGLAQKYDLVHGFPNGTFSPKSNANREMGAAMAANLLKAFDVVDKENQTAPAISNVSIKSSNSNPSLAKAGDSVTLTFTTTEQVTKLGNFKINGSNPATFTSEGSEKNWTNTATYLLESSDPEGEVNFQINVQNKAGIYSVTTETTNDGSSVTVLAAPVISNVIIVSNNIDPTKATVGDTVNLTFTTNQEVSKLSNFKINGGNPASFTSTEQPDHTWNNIATYVIDPSDPTAPMTFQINVKNVVGLYSITTETTTDGSSVTVF
ncbi:MAG: S-layer homology domain-containing protein [Candidatus Pristimantibacillus sp.]